MRRYARADGRPSDTRPAVRARRPRPDGWSGRPTSWASAPPARARPGGTASSPRTPMSCARPACRRRSTSSTTAGPATSTTPPSPRTRVLPAAGRQARRRVDAGLHARCVDAAAPATRGAGRAAARARARPGRAIPARAGRWPRTASRSARRPVPPPTRRSTAASTRTSCCGSGGPSRASRCSCSSTSAASPTRWRAAPHVRLPRARPGGRRRHRPSASASTPRTGPKVALTAWQEDVLARRYAPENERLAALVPDLDLVAVDAHPRELRVRTRRLARARLARLASLARPSGPGPPPPPACPDGWHGRTARLRRGRGAEGGHVVVERAHRPASRRPSGGRPAQGAPLLRPSLGGRLQRARTACRYWRYFPRPDGGVSGEWTPGYLIDFWTPELIARAAPDARVLVLLRDPLERFRSGPDPPARDEHARASGTATSRARSSAASTRRSCAACWRRSRPSRCTSASTRPAAPIQRGELAGRTRSSAWRRSTPARTRYAAKLNPTTSRKFEPRRALRPALLDGWAPDLQQLPALVPGLDLSLWPSAREVGLPSPRSSAAARASYQSSSGAMPPRTAWSRRRPSPAVGSRRFGCDVRG